MRTKLARRAALCILALAHPGIAQASLERVETLSCGDQVVIFSPDETVSVSCAAGREAAHRDAHSIVITAGGDVSLWRPYSSVDAVTRYAGHIEMYAVEQPLRPSVIYLLEQPTAYVTFEIPTPILRLAEPESASSLGVPEPSSGSLMLLAGAWIFARRARRNKERRAADSRRDL